MDEQDINKDINKGKMNLGVIVAILIGAWFIGASILGAGYLISKEVGKSNGFTENIPANNEPVDIEVPAGMPVLGDNNAPVTIVEFADFQCPFCGQWQKEISPELKKEFIDTGKARFVFMDFAFLGEESNKAAEAARCAMDQNKFWEYHDKLFASQQGENEGAFSDDKLKQFARELSLNTTDFNTCLDTRKHKAAVENDLNKGTGYGVNSTPTVFINGIKLEGLSPWESYKQIIDAKLDQ